MSIVLGCAAKGHSIDDTSPFDWCSTCRAPSTDTKRVWNEASASRPPPKGRPDGTDHPVYIPGCEEKGHSVDDTSPYLWCSDCRAPATVAKHVYPRVERSV